MREERPSASRRGYGRRWQSARTRFLLTHPLCGMRPSGLAPVMSRCHDEGRTTIATVVDHVRPHRGDERLFWDVGQNWQAHCADCHRRKTGAGL